MGMDTWGLPLGSQGGGARDRRLALRLLRSALLAEDGPAEPRPPLPPPADSPATPPFKAGPLCKVRGSHAARLFGE